MDKKQLEAQLKTERDALLKKIQASIDSAASSISAEYQVEKVSKDYKDEFVKKEWQQEISHRDKLLGIVVQLAQASFLLLAVIVVWHMVVRLVIPNYTGVSDNVIQIIAVSVFGQVLVVMGALSHHLWKNKRR